LWNLLWNVSSTSLQGSAFDIYTAKNKKSLTTLLCRFISVLYSHTVCGDAHDGGSGFDAVGCSGFGDRGGGGSGFDAHDGGSGFDAVGCSGFGDRGGGGSGFDAFGGSGFSARGGGGSGFDTQRNAIRVTDE
jgi:hypothetical protein